MKVFKCWGFLRTLLMILQLLFVNTAAAVSLSLPLCPRVYSVVKGKIYVCTKVPLETFEDFLFLNLVIAAGK